MKAQTFAVHARAVFNDETDKLHASYDSEPAGKYKPKLKDPPVYSDVALSQAIRDAVPAKSAAAPQLGALVAASTKENPRTPGKRIGGASVAANAGVEAEAQAAAQARAEHAQHRQSETERDSVTARTLVPRVAAGGSSSDGDVPNSDEALAEVLRAAEAKAKAASGADASIHG